MDTLLPRVYPIVDTAALARRGGSPVAFADALLEGGAGILQLRHKQHFTREMLRIAMTVRDACRQTGCVLVINDRADIAAILDAGLHLGQDDLPPALARRVLGPSRPLGFSTHSEAQLAAADSEPVSYLAIGPVFSTASKENPDPPLGLSRLPALRATTKKPLVAIGGITRETAPAVWAAGVESIAVIGDLLSAGIEKHLVRERMEEWLNL